MTHVIDRPLLRRLLAVGLVLAPLGACQNVQGVQSVDCSPTDGLPTGAGIQPGGFWQSSPWVPEPGERWLDYGGGCLVTLPHDLDHAPSLVQVYVSFSPTGDMAGLAAGDVTRVIDVTDQDVTIRNSTAEDFFVRVVLQ